MKSVKQSLVRKKTIYVFFIVLYTVIFIFGFMVFFHYEEHFGENFYIQNSEQQTEPEWYSLKSMSSLEVTARVALYIIELPLGILFWLFGKYDPPGSTLFVFFPNSIIVARIFMIIVFTGQNTGEENKR